MAAADDPTPPSFWRRLMELVGVDDEVDAVTDKITRARDWVNAKLPAATPEQQARAKTFDAGMEAWRAKRGQQTQAFINSSVIDPVKRILGSAPVQGIAHQFKEDYAPLWETAPSTEALAQLGHQALDERNAPAREAMARAGIPAVVGDILNAPNDWIPHQLIDQGVQNSTPLGIATNLDLPIGPALKAAAPFVGGAAAHLAAVLPPGFYSRVERVAEQVGKKGIHPNKLASLLKSGASQEEVAYRNLPDLITRKGNQLISKEELAAHLAQHPPPGVEPVVRGELPTRGPDVAFPVREEAGRPGRSYYSIDLPHGGIVTVAQNRDGWEVAGSGLGAFDSAEEALAAGQQYANDVLHRQAVTNAGVATKYKSYTLPGGEAYRETLLTRPRPRLADFPTREGYNQAVEAAGPPYQSGHWDEPDILTHIRSTERTLPPEARSLPEIEQIIQDVVGARHPEHIASGGPQMAVAQGLLSHDEAAAYGRSRGFINYPHDPGERGRFLEEIQSDWHQAGTRQGYAQVTPEMAAQADALRPQLVEAEALMQEKHAAHQAAHNAFLDVLREKTMPQLPPEFAHLTSLQQALREGDPATRAWRYARDGVVGVDPEVRVANQAATLAGTVRDRAIDRVNHFSTQLKALESPTGVPDAPFKETWPDLALKQQLLDVAHRRDLSWLGLSGSKTHVDRYGTERLAWQPEGQGFRVNWEPQVGGAGEGIEDLGQEALARGLITNASEYVETPEQLAQILGDSSDVKAEKAWKRIQASPEGGVYLPRKEGMESFYDRELPGKLNKLLKPFGGAVERGELPVPGKAPGPVTRYRVIDRSGQRGLASYQNMSQREAERAAGTLNIGYAGNPWAVVEPYQTMGEVDATVHEPAWIARLSPEVKARIAREGFPLLSLAPLAAGAGLAGAAAASDDPDQRAALAAAAAGVPLFPRGPRRPHTLLGASFLPNPGRR